MRIAVGMIMQETNSFSTIKTDVIGTFAQSPTRKSKGRFTPSIPSKDLTGFQRCHLEVGST